MAYNRRKRKIKKNIPEAVAHIHSTYNNTIVTISDKDGNASFKLKFTEEDIGKTYKYQLSLVPGKMNGLTYSDKKYDIEITISLNENNKLVATITMNGSVLGDIYAEFLNIYHVVPNVPSSPSTVDKSDNASYVRMLIMTAGGLMMLIIMQNEHKVEFSMINSIMCVSFCNSN